MHTQLLAKIKHPYIEKIKGICGGKAVIKGTRIKVTQIAVEHLDLNISIEEILKIHPDLQYWQVYDALSYYYENQAEMDRELVDEMKFVRNIRPDYPSKLKRVVELDAI